MRQEVRREVARKALHMAMGHFALCLRWLSPWQAALCAFAALAHNLWLFPHYGMKRLERPEEKAQGYSGMVGYPAVVLFLALLAWNPRAIYLALQGSYDWHPALACVAGAWAIMAFGDASATLAGLTGIGPAMPWNPRKSWIGTAAFVVVGGTLSAVWYAFVAGHSAQALRWPQLAGVSLAAALLAGLVESLPGQIDDNLTVPVFAWLVFSFCDPQGLRHLADALSPVLAGRPSVGLLALLGLNAGLGLCALCFRWVGPASCVLGILFGTLVALGLGWKGYLFLLAFYLISQLSTFFGKRVKRQRGIEEPDGGRRGVGSVFSKGLLPALLALVSPLAFVASLAVYAADTAASEFGKASGGTARLLFRRGSVPHGTVGAVSRAGTLAGLAVLVLFTGMAAAVSMAWDPAFFMPDDYRAFAGCGAMASVGAIDLAILLFSCLLGCAVAFFGESLLNEKVVQRGWLSKEIGHLFTGWLAAALPFGIAALIVALVARFT
jgi:uncharacterized protein (TIGR00297 family)